MQPALTVPVDKPEMARRRKRFPLGFLLAAVAIFGAVLYLVYVNTQTSAVYYLTVPELQQCTDCGGRSVRIAGYVQTGSIQHHADNSVSFIIEEHGETLAVTYRGILPDIFQDGVQAVVEGTYTPSGNDPFQAQVLLAKCPSKFQSGTPEASTP